MRISPRRHGPRRARGSNVRAMLVIVAVMSTCLVTPATAYAAEGSLCADSGVNVVVDFKELGGGVQLACDESGAGKVATEVFEAAGFELTPVGAFPGAACRVDGKPADVACAKMPPADAYWGLYVGANGKWDYAPTGADELKPKDGDFVSFAWQASSTSSPPAVAPVAQPVQPSEEPVEDAASEDTEEQDDEGGVPWWVPALAVLALAAGGAGIALRRRGSGST